VQADAVPIAAHGQERCVLRGGGEARQAGQGGAVDAETFIGQRADDEGLRAQMIEFGAGILGHEPLALERLQQPVRGRFGEAGLGDGIGQPEPAAGAAGNDAQQRERAVEALGPGSVGFGQDMLPYVRSKTALNTAMI
jgi:hypothetical protein